MFTVAVLFALYSVAYIPIYMFQLHTVSYLTTRIYIS
jgi:hypothetical protein